MAKRAIFMVTVAGTNITAPLLPVLQSLETEEATRNQTQARHDHRHTKANEDEAKQQAGSDKATTERDAAEGTCTIEGNTAAIPDGLCIIAGARAGIDGPYRIESVTHTYSRGGGFVTALSLKKA